MTLWIFVALFVGVIFGWLCPSIAIKMQPVADAFLRMIKMIIAPLLFSVVVTGIASHGNIKSLGKTTILNIKRSYVTSVTARIFPSRLI